MRMLAFVGDNLRRMNGETSERPLLADEKAQKEDALAFWKKRAENQKE